MSKEEEALYHKLINEYEKNLDIITRYSHKWAVANTWWYYNYYRKTSINRKEGIPNTINLFNENFGETYKGKKVISASGFLLVERLWRVNFEDGSWIIAFDAGNGWYDPMTDFNSYKINIPY